MEVGDKLNPQRSYRKGFALKGLCQHIIKMNNPSTIRPGELLRQVLFDIRGGNSNLAKSLCEKSNHAMYQDENPHRCLLSLQN